MCRNQKLLGAVLTAAGAGVLLGLFIGKPVADFFIAAGLILGGVLILLK